jgi:hypothetical protein
VLRGKRPSTSRRTRSRSDKGRYSSIHLCSRSP